MPQRPALEPLAEPVRAPIGAPAVVDLDGERRAVAFAEGRLDRVGQTRRARRRSTLMRSTMTASDVAPRSASSPSRGFVERQRPAVDQQAAEAAAPQRVERRERPDPRPAAAASRLAVDASNGSVVVAVVCRRRPRRPRSPSRRPADRHGHAPGSRSRPAGACPAGSASSALATTSGDSRSTSLAALPADRPADARPQQPQVVVNLGGRADRRARIADAVLLADGDRRRDAVDAVDVRLLHPLEELAGVGGERLDVAALPFGVDGVEGERRLARPADAGEDDQLPVRQRQIDALQVVGAGAADDEDTVRDDRGRRGVGHGSTVGPPAHWPRQPCYYGILARPRALCLRRAAVLSCQKFNHTP